MRYLLWFLITAALLAIESPLLRVFHGQIHAPDVLLITALYAGSRGALLPGALLLFAVGLTKDGFTLAAPVGVFTEIGVLCFLTARVLVRRVDLRSTIPLMATAAAMSLVATAMFLLLEAIFHRAFAGYEQVLAAALPMAMATMLLAPVQFWLLGRADRLLGRRDQHLLVGR